MQASQVLPTQAEKKHFFIDSQSPDVISEPTSVPPASVTQSNLSLSISFIGLGC